MSISSNANVINKEQKQFSLVLLEGIYLEQLQQN